MGGCVSSVMSYQNARSINDAPIYNSLLHYGTINEKYTQDEADRSGIYRCAHLTDKEHTTYLHDWYYGENVLQTMYKNRQRWADTHAIAFRKVKSVQKEMITDDKGKHRQWEFINLNDPSYITYGQFWDLLTSFGKGLAQLGMKKSDKVAIFEETRWEWITSMLGMWTQEIIGVTVYANLGKDALIYALIEADCKAIICNGSKVPVLLDLMQNAGLHDTTIIYLDELPCNFDGKNHHIVSWTSVLKCGNESKKDYVLVHNPDAQLLIMYTSGTTGNPKGVIHSIGAITHGACALTDRLNELIGHQPNETYVSYLPAAHIFEFICQILFLNRGILLCFGSPRTLTDVSARPCGDISFYKPFFLIAVPRILQAIKKTVQSKLPPPGTLKRRIFDEAYASRLRALKQGKDTPYWNSKVFAQPRRLMGPNMRAICCGGAPLAHNTQQWVNVVLGVPLAQGFGMTQTVCNCSVQRVGGLCCMAGQCLRGLQVRLLDSEEYKHTDQPHPRGELLIHGPIMFKGYWKQSNLTSQSMLPGGWFRTGDVAQMNKTTGEIAVIGRIKALAKNVLGQYIALQNLEALYGQHPLVIPNGVCVLVNSQKSFITALILTDEAKACKFAKEHKINGQWPEILNDPQFNTAVAASLVALAKCQNLMPFEFVKRVRILNDEWTPQNGLMTASMKVRRSQIDKHYATIINELFAE